MNKRHLPKAWLAIIFCALPIAYVALWLGRSPALPAVSQPEIALQPQTSAEQSLDPVAAASQFAASPAGAAEPENEVASPEPPRVEEAPWIGRYPSAEVLDERIVKDAPDRFRRQQLLLTGHDRIPSVIWEERFRREASGEWMFVGKTAYMGNVFLAQTAPDRVDPAELRAFIEEHDLFVERESAASGYATLGIDEPELGRLEALVAAYQERFPQAIVELEIINFTSAAPSDWKSDRLWGLDQIKALDAWELQTGSSQVVVAVLDTGLERTHPDIKANLFVNPKETAGNGSDDDRNGFVDDVSGWDFFADGSGDATPEDDDGHGTHVAGITGSAGNNAVGSVGVAWNVRILPLKVGDFSGLRTSSIVEALEYVSGLKKAGVNIVATNNSYGSSSPSTATRDQIEQHKLQGILFVAAAGNDGINLDADADSQQYPAGYTVENIISVGNSNQEDTLTASSNRGSVSVDLSAPGDSIYSTYAGGGYSYLSGTSMASPMVSGAVALLASAEPGLNWQQLRDRIYDTADLVPSQKGLSVTGGRLNLLSMLKPELKGHGIAVTNLRDSIIILDTEETKLRFDVQALESALVTAEVIEGPGVGSLRQLSSGIFEFTPAGVGLARIRFTAELQGVLRHVEKTVVVEATPDVLSGLLHRYEFGSSETLEPDLASTASGTLNDVTRVETEFGRSARFKGGSSKMEFSGSYSSKVTIAALVKSEDLVESPHPRIVNMPFYYLFFSSGSGSGVPDGNRQTLKFFADRNPSAGIWNAPPRSIRDNEWVYVVGTYDSDNVDNEPSLYINGELQVARRQQDPQGTPLIGTAKSYLGNNGDDDRAFEGLMASVRIYDRELTAGEVSALGANLAQEKWSRYAIAGQDAALLNSVATFSVSDADALGSDLSVEWTVEGVGEYVIESASGDEIKVRFLDGEIYKLRAQVSDGVSTRFFSKTVEIAMAQAYMGKTSGGGVILLEVDPSLKSGHVSVFDTESGFYRINEAIVIEESGSFATLEDSVGRISGTLTSGDVLGEVTGYGLTFSGSGAVPLSELSSFAGVYVGGVVGSAGDRLELTVWDDGRSMLWREGASADLTFGRVETDGTFNFTSARGEAIVGVIDLDSARVAGSIGGADFFQKPVGKASRSRMRGGAIAGMLSGGGTAGLYGNFVSEGELTEPRLPAGVFAGGASGTDDSTFIALQADAPPFFGQASGVAAPLEIFGDAVAAGELDLSGKPLRAIQAQIQLSELGGTMVGFSIFGDEPKEVLVRGLGPSFAQNDGALDPSISLYRMESGELVEIAANLNWSDGMLFTGAGENAQGVFRALKAGFEQLEISPLPIGSLDAAMRIWLAPGTYVLQAKAEAGEIGASFLEVFELP